MSSAHLHFDEAAIVAASQKRRRESQAKTGLPGSLGCQARFNVACMGRFNLALVREVNRGTDVEHIAAGGACVVANMVVSLALSVGDTPEHTVAAANRILTQVKSNIAVALTKPRDEFTIIQPVPGGRA